MSTLSPLHADTFPTLEAAQDYITAHDADARKLARARVADLKEMHTGELAGRRIIPVMGGARSHDELERAVLELRFPRIKEAYEIRAYFHNRQSHEHYVTDMAMRLVNISDENLAVVLKAAGPHARARLRAALEVDG